MDVNKCLAELRECLTELVGSPEYRDVPEVFEVSERFNALDEWLKKGGFLPGDWACKSRS